MEDYWPDSYQSPLYQVPQIYAQNCNYPAAYRGIPTDVYSSGPIWPQQMPTQQIYPQERHPQEMQPQQMYPQRMPTQQMHPQEMQPQQMHPRELQPQPQQIPTQQMPWTVRIQSTSSNNSIW